MDCNKDEAIRAKQLAENKMEKSDFEGARKIALKAQNLYPELENISQLLSVCDVHCSAKKQVGGSEKDWYGILQVGTLSDEATVKKQYRRLALILHPDKNRFPGAEAAFKLICEANVLLSDPTKKSIYDSKIRAQTGYASVNRPPYHMNRSSQLNKQCGPPSHAYTHYSSLHQHQTIEPSFWTSCPFCSMKYQYHRKFVNTSLCCQKCLKNFTGYETSAPPTGVPWTPATAQHMPAKPSMGQTTGFQEWAVPGRSAPTTGIHNVKGSSSNFEHQQPTSRKPVQTKPGVCGDLKSRGTSKSVNSMHDGKLNSDVNNGKRAKLNNKSMKKGRKFIVESSESCDTSSDSDVTINANLGDCGSDLNSGPVHFPRRSTRKRQNISYHEDDNEDDDDDLPSKLKSSEGSKLSDDEKEQNTSEGKNSEPGIQDCRQMETDRPEESMHNKDANGDKEVKERGDKGGMSSTSAYPIEIESDSDQDTFLNNIPAGDISVCPDPEFNDFDKNREESCFSVNQFWACYDSVDSMPRYYAKVKKVRRTPFAVTLTWLEADPMDEAGKKWGDAFLPIGCGNFKLGKTEKTSQLPIFSHRIHCDGKKRGSFIIYPRRGEVWALFKDWDFSWSSCPEMHREYKYEIVEVLSEFDESQGIKVCYLDRVTGFVSLFERSTRSKTSAFLVAPSELHKFSHLIPCYRMTGSERQGVPKGSFELDPASLPSNPDDLDYPGKQKMETSAPPKSAVEKG